jgi:hypothetical protein
MLATPPDRAHEPIGLPVPQAVRGEPIAVLDVRVGSDRDSDSILLNGPRHLAGHGYRLLGSRLHLPDDTDFTAFERLAKEADAPLVAIPDRGPWDWHVLRDLLALCQREQIRIWHAHDFKTTILGLMLNRLWPMRLVASVHGDGPVPEPMLAARLNRLCLPRYERVFVETQNQFTACINTGIQPERLILLDPAIDTERVIRHQAITSAKVARKIPIEQTVIGVSGHDLKGIQAAVRDHNVHFVELPDTDGLEALDVYIWQGTDDTSPTALLEAMAMNVPCLARRTTITSSIIDHGVNGLFVNPDDPAGLRLSLKRLLVDTFDREAIGRMARRTVETRFSLPVRLARLARVFDAMMGIAYGHSIDSVK